MARSVVSLVVALLAVLAGTVPTGAWGFDLHRYITGEAIALLPDGLRPFFERRRAFVVEHSIDPDLWRVAGFEEEPPRHFVDLDAYGAPPFPDLPREYDLAVQRHGRAFVERNGVLPWRVAEIYGNLVRSMREAGRGVGWAHDNVAFHAAVLAHYVADAHVPFHAVLNYDGQLTNQHGIHARFETELHRRYAARLVIAPVARPPVTNPRDFVFDALMSGFPLASDLLAADLAAIGEGDTYDDAYFERFFERARPVLEQRIAAAIAGVAAVIAGAWEEAGRPDLTVEPPPPVRKRRVTP